MTSPSDRPDWYDAILPVIDIRHGHVVRGLAGRRDEYQQIDSRYTEDSRPGSVAHVYANRFGFRDCYVADLNAICDRHLDVAALEAIAVQGLNVWLDAAVGSVSQWEAHEKSLRDWRPFRWIVALESLERWCELEALLEKVGPERVVFSLDLKEGRPLTSQKDFADMEAVEIARQATSLGVKSMIVLDLAAVGEGKGSLTESLIDQLHDKQSTVELIGGGGMSWPEDIEALARCGVQRILVASALHDGRIAPIRG
ncbi:HisA/HisF-related TIM barrel protein [Bremerella sp. T1]|uniref:HisA/HisF-related TIM barrel protein n=1 Tax=Bremerella sp. TYQ1 TaxID=3119568 RepID=UPI001CCE6DAE|nr:HisA/HisF-related TIM barrel protein [Bremerella volcania]UBM33718.1 hypothetical protein LA756_13545 [Bremerella volcania]